MLRFNNDTNNNMTHTPSKVKAAINFVSALLFLSRVYWPWANYHIPAISIIVFLGIWIATMKFSYFSIRALWNLIPVIILVLLFLAFKIFGNFQYHDLSFGGFIFYLLYFFTGAVFFDYYFATSSRRTMQILKFAILAFVGFGLVQTLVGVLRYPYATRMLAGVHQLSSFYSSIGIGDYDFVYGCVLIVPALTYLARNGKFRLLYICFLMLDATTIYFSGYTIGLFLTVVGCLVTLYFVSSKPVKVVVVIALILLVPAYFSFIQYDYVTLIYKIPSNLLRTKLLDFFGGIFNSGFGSQSTGRIDRYQSSLRLFLQHPLLGMNATPDLSSYGRHSGILDMLAQFGIIVSCTYFYVFAMIFRRQYKIMPNRNVKRIYLITIALLVTYSFVNPLLYIYRIGFSFFLLQPLLLTLGSNQHRSSRGKHHQYLGNRLISVSTEDSNQLQLVVEPLGSTQRSPS